MLDGEPGLRAGRSIGLGGGESAAEVTDAVGSVVRAVVSNVPTAVERPAVRRESREVRSLGRLGNGGARMAGRPRGSNSRG